MSNEKIIVDPELYAEFLSDCKCIYLENEYPKHIGKERFLILSDLSEKELRAKYGILLKKYEPFILDTMRLYDPIHDYKLNEDKHLKRYIRNTINVEISDLDARFYKGLQTKDILTKLIEENSQNEVYKKMYICLKMLPEKQLRRLLMWALKNMTYEEISIVENISKKKAFESIQTAIQNFIRFFNMGDEDDGE